METSLRNQFLIAMPGLEDEHFSHTVSLVCEHNEHGAIGLVINRPMELTVADMMRQMDLDGAALDPTITVHWGGPVQPERGFVIHTAPNHWESSLPLGDDLYITTSRDILSALSKGEGPATFVVILGYAGWDEGQLEDEILRNSWLHTPIDRSILFRLPARDRWQAATRLLGVDVSQLTPHAGHA